MSHRIEFDFAAWRIPAAEAGTPEDQLLVASLGGDNNVITSSGAVARKWSALCLGTRQEAIRQACHLAKSCEGGSVKLSGRRDISPESYIGKLRRLIDNAPHISEGRRGDWFSKSFKIWETVASAEALRISNPALIESLYAFGEPEKRKDWYSEVKKLQWKFSIDTREMQVFFKHLPYFSKSRYAWDLVEINGPGTK